MNGEHNVRSIYGVRFQTEMKTLIIARLSRTADDSLKQNYRSIKQTNLNVLKWLKRETRNDTNFLNITLTCSFRFDSPRLIEKCQTDIGIRRGSIGCLKRNNKKLCDWLPLETRITFFVMCQTEDIFYLDVSRLQDRDGESIGCRVVAQRNVHFARGTVWCRIFA